jgi:hypothetical protein
MGTNNDSNNANNESFPGYVDGTDCTSDSDCAGTCGGEDTCEGGGGDGVLPDGESCTDDVDCAGTCGGDDTCEGDPYGGEGPNNGTNNNNSTNNNSTNNDTTGPNNDTTGGSGNNVEDAAEGETGGLCPDTCPTPPQVPATTACDGCSEGRCHHTSPFDLYCTRACEGPADCEDLGTDWNCENGSCVL